MFNMGCRLVAGFDNSIVLMYSGTIHFNFNIIYAFIMDYIYGRMYFSKILL